MSWSAIHDVESRLSAGNEWRKNNPEKFEEQYKKLFKADDEASQKALDDFYEAVDKSDVLKDALAYRLGIENGDIEDIPKLLNPDRPGEERRYPTTSDPFTFKVDPNKNRLDDEEGIVYTETGESTGVRFGLDGPFSNPSVRTHIHEAVGHGILGFSDGRLDGADGPGATVHLTNIAMDDLYPDEPVEKIWRTNYGPNNPSGPI